MSRIVIDARESGSSTGRYVDELIRYLHKLAPAHEFIILTKSERLPFMAQTVPNFKAVAADYKEFTFAEQLGLKKLIESQQPDLVFFPAAQQPVWYRGKVVTTIQDLTTVRFRNPEKNPLVFWLKLQVYKWVIKQVTRKSTAVITPSQFVKDDTAQFTGIDPSKITVTYEAADVFADVPQPIDNFVGKDFIMFNGRPLPHKNLRRVIEAFAVLSVQYPNLYLMLAGKKNSSQVGYVALADKLGIGDKVILTDWITDGQLKWAMQHTKAYIYASLSEGFGLPPLEAMLYGAPVVSSNATCMPEVLGDAVHYFNPTDVHDMATKIAEVLDDPVLREELIEKGAKQVKKYSWKHMAEQTLVVFEKALRQAN